jgi:hypothetical protein
MFDCFITVCGVSPKLLVANLPGESKLIFQPLQRSNLATSATRQQRMGLAALALALGGLKLKAIPKMIIKFGSWNDHHMKQLKQLKQPRISVDKK